MNYGRRDGHLLLVEIRNLHDSANEVLPWEGSRGERRWQGEPDGGDPTRLAPGGARAVVVAIDDMWVMFLLVNNHTGGVHPPPTVVDSVGYWMARYDGMVSHKQVFRERSSIHFHELVVLLVPCTGDEKSDGKRWEPAEDVTGQRPRGEGGGKSFRVF